MRKTMVRIFAAVLVLAMAIGFLAMIPASAATESVQFFSNNVKYDDCMKLMYAVYNPQNEAYTIKLTANGEECGIVMVEENVNINGTICTTYVSEYGVPLQNIATVITAELYVDNELKDTCTYSVLEYLHEMQTLFGAGLRTDEKQAEKLAMYDALLDAAAAIQTVLDGASTIGNYGYVYVTNGTINGEQGALLNAGTTITADDLAVDGVATSWQYKTVGGEFAALPEDGLTIANSNYILTAEIEEPSEPTDPTVPDVTEPAQTTEEATITFDSTNKITEFDSASHTTWEEGSIVVTNNKGSYANALAQYANPARFYKGTTLTIEHFDMTKIVFNCDSATYATTLAGGIEGATVDGTAVTIELAEATNSVTYTMPAQIRVDSIVITYVACPHNNTASVEAKAATCTETGIEEGTVICNDCQAYISGGIIAANGHTYDSEITQDATCTDAGVTTYTCSVCDDSYTEEIEALGHSYVDGACERCGEADPNAGADFVEQTITFNLGTNGTATHADGSSKTSYSETVDGYTLSLTATQQFYTGARDAKGNSAIKLGSSSKFGGFTFTVPENVDKVIIYVAGYKANTAKITVGGASYTVSTLSNNGDYTAIEIDTSTTKEFTFATVSGGVRAMINTIEFVAKVEQ